VGSTGYVLDFTTGVQLAPISGPITTAFWLQNDWLLVQGVDPARLVAPATGATLAALSGYTSLITAAQWHPNGRLATAEQNGIIHIWDTVNGEEVRRFRDDQPIPEAFSVHRLVWSPQGEYLLAASDKVTLWDAESGQVIWSSGSLGFEKAYTDLSPNGQLVAITAGANFFVLDSKTGTSLWSNQAHTQPLTGIAWIKGATWPDQERVNWLIGGLSRWINGQPWRPADARLLLLTWGGDGTVRLWDWQHQVEILRLADTGPILTTAVSPDGASILTVAGASVRIWDMWHQDPDRLRNLAHSRITR